MEEKLEELRVRQERDNPRHIPGQYQITWFNKYGVKVGVSYETAGLLTAQKAGQKFVDSGMATSFVIHHCLCNSALPEMERWQVKPDPTAGAKGYE